MNEHEAVEELHFGDSATGVHDPGGIRRRRRRRLLRIVAVAAAVAVVAAGCGGWLLWRDVWRSVPFTVNGRTVEARVGSTLDEVLARNHDFGARPGRLLSVTGRPLAGHRGGDVRIAVDGRTVGRDALASLHPAEGMAVTLRDGADRVEGHRERFEPIRHRDDPADVATGGLIQLHLPGADGERRVWIGAVSGQKADRGVVRKPRDGRTVSMTPHPPQGRKVIALTFDDGPSEYTPKMLDILRKKKVKATFFDLGRQAAQMPDVVRRMVREGHQVASHSDTHPDIPEMGTAELRDELESGFAHLKEAGSGSRMFRAPYGAFTDRDWERAGDLVSTNVLWSIDTLDWKRPGARTIHDEVTRNAYSGAIVLMHTGGGDRTQDIEALPGIIDDLRGKGYEFVTVGELMAMDREHRFPDWACDGRLPPVAR